MTNNRFVHDLIKKPAIPLSRPLLAGCENEMAGELHAIICPLTLITVPVRMREQTQA
jgi:hypothetical protein